MTSAPSTERVAAALTDTSVWVAREAKRGLDTAALPDRLYVCSITMGELEAGVLAAQDTATRAARMATVSELAGVALLPVDREAARRWAALRVQVQEAGRRANVNDLWIAAVALANGLPVVTQDNDFDVLQDVSDLQVIRV